MEFIAIILARGGSKGIPKKNIYPLLGKPLISYTINQLKEAGLDQIYISSDDEKILKIASDLGTQTILRPAKFASDISSSEDAWIHSVDHIKNNFGKDNFWIIAPQITSPLRSNRDFEEGIKMAKSGMFDSIISSNKFDDMCIWKGSQSISYDYLDRKRRQDNIDSIQLENGSFYIFKSNNLLKFRNRIHGRIGFCEMDKLKMFQLDETDDIVLLEQLMKFLKINT